jgi:hypothetical protein
MGMFSYMCAISGKQICEPDLVRLYYLVDGQIVEEMRGAYNAYGSVEIEDMTYHALRGMRIHDKPRNISCSGDIWISRDWDHMVNVHFDSDPSSGFCAVLESSFYKSFVPTEVSDDDPNQGMKDEDETQWSNY